MIVLLAYVAGATAVGATGLRLWSLRRGARSREFTIFFITSCGFALAALLLAPFATLTSLNATSGLEVSTLLGDGLRLSAAGATAIFAVLVNGGGRRPLVVQLRWLALVEGLLTVTFLASGLHHEPGTTELTGIRGWVIAFDVIRLSYPMWCMGSFFFAMLPYARRLPPGPARLGSQLLANAAVVGILWSGWTADDIFTVVVRGHQNSGDDAPSAVFQIALIALVAAGITATAWARSGLAPVQWWRDLRHYRAMRPLWRSLCTDPDESRRRVIDRLDVQPWRASLACYRRVIEIRDGQLALRAFADATPVTWQTADEEAALIRRALAARSAAGSPRGLSAGMAPPGMAPPGMAPPGMGLPGAGAWSGSEFESVESEARWLASVSRAFALGKGQLTSV